MCYSEAKMQGVVRAALIAIVVVFAQVQCVAACADSACADAAKRESMPPCHRHHNPSSDQDSSSCVHEALSAASIPQQAVQVELPAYGAAVSGTSAGIVRDTWCTSPYPSNLSPPGTPDLSSVVLRI